MFGVGKKSSGVGRIGGKGKKTGVRKLKVKKGKEKEGAKKENHGDRENRTVVAHNDRETFAQEPNALPVAYWDSPASL